MTNLTADPIIIPPHAYIRGDDGATFKPNVDFVVLGAKVLVRVQYNSKSIVWRPGTIAGIHNECPDGRDPETRVTVMLAADYGYRSPKLFTSRLRKVQGQHQFVTELSIKPIPANWIEREVAKLQEQIDAHQQSILNLRRFAQCPSPPTT